MKIYSISFAVITLLLSGCSSTQQLYSGPRLAADQVADVTPESGEISIYIADKSGRVRGVSSGVFGATIEEVDGVAINSPSSRIEILPGPHTVKVGWWGGRYRSATTKEIKMAAVAGKHYVVQVLQVTSFGDGMMNCKVGITEKKADFHSNRNAEHVALCRAY